MSDVEEKLAEASKKCKFAEAVEAKAKSKAKAVEAEVAQLKNKLKEIEAALASEKKQRLEAQAKAIDVERKTWEQVAEVGRIAVEAFRTSTEYSDEKCTFNQYVFNIGLDICRKKVMECFPNIDWSFLYHLREEKEDVTEETSIVEMIGGTSEATAPSEIVPASIFADVIPPSQVLEQPIVVTSSLPSVDPYVEIGHN